MIRIGTNARLVCIAVTFLTPMCAQTGAWTPPVVLSTGGQGWESTAAIDGNGNSVALWDERTTQDQLWSRSKSSASNGGDRPVTESPPALQTTSVFPAVRMSTSGFATAVWSDQNGVWTADRPPASSWNPPELVIPGAANPIFVMNSLGDAAIAWTVGGTIEHQRLSDWHFCTASVPEQPGQLNKSWRAACMWSPIMQESARTAQWS